MPSQEGTNPEASAVRIKAPSKFEVQTYRVQLQYDTLRRVCITKTPMSTLEGQGLGFIMGCGGTAAHATGGMGNKGTPRVHGGVPSNDRDVEGGAAGGIPTHHQWPRSTRIMATRESTIQERLLHLPTTITPGWTPNPCCHLLVSHSFDRKRAVLHPMTLPHDGRTCCVRSTLAVARCLL